MDRDILTNRWLPPSPHRERVLEAIDQGKAYIRDRGHSTPALLVFEDGGQIELPRVRYTRTHRGVRLADGGEAATARQTRHQDVCGTLDELKAVVRENPEAAARHPERIRKLLDDMAVMLGRMRRRHEAYQRFAGDMQVLAEELTGIAGPDTGPALAEIEELRRLLDCAPDGGDGVAGEVDERAESIRATATMLEQCLAEHKRTALKVRALFEAVKGARQW